MKIVTEPNTILHQKCAKVKKFDKSLHDFAIEMIDALRKYNGVGLSAVQLGKPINMTVIEYIPQNMDENSKKELRANESIPLMILVNAKITKFSDKTYIAPEGCLSLPEKEYPIKRSCEVHVLAQDINGERVKIRARDFFARILQHELDHANGILITDKIYHD